MSAWIVSKAHIDALVNAAGSVDFQNHSSGMSWWNGDERHEMTYSDRVRASEVGMMLWATNLESINARYPDTIEDESGCPGPNDFEGSVSVAEYRFTPTRDLEPEVILKAISCYEYQSCEHEGWKTSEAKSFCEALEHKMIGRLPAYNLAPWGLEESYVHGSLIHN